MERELEDILGKKVNDIDSAEQDEIVLGMFGHSQSESH